MSRSDSILRNTFFIFLAKIIDLAAAIVASILVARILGVSGSGRYYFVIAYVSIFGLVVNLGIDHIIIREVAKAPQQLSRLLGITFKLKLLLLLLIVPLLLAGLFIFKLDNELKYGVLLLFIAQVALRELFTIIGQAVFLGMEKLQYRASTTLISQILRTGGIAGVLIAGYGLIPLFAVMVVADAILGYWTVRIIYRHFALPEFRVSFQEVWEFLKQSFPIGLGFGFTTAFFQLDTLLLTGMRGDYENGLFSNAYRIVVTLILVMVQMIWVLLPHLTRSFQQSKEALKKEGEFYLKMIATAMIPSAIVLGTYATPLMTFAFGEQFHPAGIALMITAPVLVIRTLAYLFDLTMTSAGKQIMVGIGAGIAFSLKLILSLILIPKLGFIGSAWSNIMAEIATFIIVYLFICKWVVKFDLLSALMRPLIIGIVILSALMILNLPALAGIIAGMIAYFILTVLGGTFNSEEREIIKFALKNRLRFILPDEK